VLVAASAASPNQPWILPEARTLKRVRIADSTVEDVK